MFGCRSPTPDGSNGDRLHGVSDSLWHTRCGIEPDKQRSGAVSVRVVDGLYKVSRRAKALLQELGYDDGRAASGAIASAP